MTSFHNASLQTRFFALDSWLISHQNFWQVAPFHCLEFPWRKTHDEFCQWLDGLTLLQVSNYRSDLKLFLSDVSSFLPDATAYFALVDLPKSSLNSVPLDDGRLSVGVPGRKWSQIQKFQSAIPMHIRGGTWLDWCAGKGYLSRVLSQERQAHLLFLEYQNTLGIAGQEFADRLKLPMTFIHCDAFSYMAGSHLRSVEHAVALHACGDLHRRLIETGVASDIASLSFSPCCYHLTKFDGFKPMFQLAQQSSLRLSALDLKLPLQEMVTASSGVRAQREVEAKYRLGFDSLQRHVLVSDAYMAVPNIQKSALKLGFEHFCQWASLKKRVHLPDGIDFSVFEAQGIARFELSEKMEMVRDLFRRPLELWMCLDRALYLEGQGYQVDISTFCERSLTPRNIFIHAEKISLVQQEEA